MDKVLKENAEALLSRSDKGGRHRRWAHGECRIGMYNYNLELVREFEDVYDAVENSGVGATYQGIVACVKGKTKKHAGHIWRKEVVES